LRHSIPYEGVLELSPDEISSLVPYNPEEHRFRLCHRRPKRLGVSVTAISKSLGLSRVILSNLVAKLSEGISLGHS
jgi:hypothetical protein